jgi:hypothetical protein
MFVWLGRRHRGQTDEFSARSLRARGAADVAAKPAAKRPRAKAKAGEAAEEPSVKRVAARAKAKVQEAPELTSIKRVAAHPKGAPEAAAKRPPGRKPTVGKPKSP